MEKSHTLSRSGKEFGGRWLPMISKEGLDTIVAAIERWDSLHQSHQSEGYRIIGEVEPGAKIVRVDEPTRVKDGVLYQGKSPIALIPKYTPHGPVFVVYYISLADGC